jgi:hypothetical protein
MLSKYNIDAILTKVLAPGVDEETLHVHHFVGDLPQEALFIITGHLGYRRIRPHILLAQVVSLFCPVGLELAHYRFAFIDKGNGLLGDFAAESFLNVEAKLLKLSLQQGETQFGLCHIRAVQGVQTIHAKGSGLQAEDFPCLEVFHEPTEVLKTRFKLSDHDFELVVLVALAVSVEIEVKEADLVLELTVVDLPHVLFG